MASQVIDNRWIKINALLSDALVLPVECRAAWLEAIDDQDQDLREVLRRLLEVQLGRTFTDVLEVQPEVQSEIQDEPLRKAGELVGRWRLLRELGRGGMGAVWLAEPAPGMVFGLGMCSEQVALKLPTVNAGAALLARVASERDILQTLRHPHIARLHEAGTDVQGRPYLALQHVEGARIDTHCARERLTSRERIDLFLQVMDAVGHAHAKWVVHRDLKPSNILVDANKGAMLLDFGIATLLDVPALHTRGAMTPRYASPEQLRGEPVGKESDIYSLGVLLHELLSGESPYAESCDTPAEWARCVIDGRLRRGLDAVIGKALARHPAARYESVAAFAAAIGRMFGSRFKPE